jgi:hypothetical protein
MNDTPAFLSLAAFARLHAVSKPCVSGWRKRGYLVLRGDEVDVAASNKRLADRPDVHHGGPAKVRPGKPAVAGAAEGQPAGGWSMHEARRREMVATARLRELALAREAGSVTDNAEAVAKVGAKLRVVRTRMLAIASKIAPRLAILDTAEACHSLVDAAVRDALVELSS